MKVALVHDYLTGMIVRFLGRRPDEFARHALARCTALVRRVDAKLA